MDIMITFIYFFSYSCKELIPDLVREIKKATNQYISENNFTKYKFEWQNGYAVFSNGYKERDMIIKYILNQETHHSKRTFREEYISLLENYNIEFKNEYVFDFFDEPDE